MEFGAATLSSKKLSNGYGVIGKSAYDGVFAAPIKLRAPSFSSRLDDYREIFGGSGASIGSSIPILEVPELNERKKNDDVRCSKIDYSNIFGGFGNLDAAVPFQELAAEAKQKESITNGASTRSKAKGGNKSCREDPSNYSKEIPVVLQPSNDAKRINMSYHKVNQGSTNGPNGTTHVAQLHAVPAYTCLIEEVNPVKINITNKPIPLAQDAYPGSNCNEGIKEAGHFPKAFTGPSPDIAKKQSSYNGVKVKKRSDSIDLFFDACEINNGSKGTHHIKVPPSETMACNLDNNNKNGDTVRSTATKWQASSSATGSDSPSYLDDMADSNSEAAASVAALTKAIEEAQLRMKYAKESMRRKKEGFQDRVKQKSNIGLKADVKKEAKLATKAMKLEEINVRQTFRETDALPQVSSDVRKPMIKVDEQVRLDIGAEDMLVAREPVLEAQKKLKSTRAERKEVVEQKDADHKTKVLELKEAEINKALLYTENTGRNASEKPEESDHTIEVVMSYWEQENNEEKDRAGPCEELVDETKPRCQEKVSAGDEAGACEEFNNETKHSCQEVVDRTNLVQEADQRLKINEGGEVENKATSLPEPRDCEINLGGRGLIAGDEKVACKPDRYEKKVEGLFELEEGQNSLRSVQELRQVEKGIVQQQKGNEEEVEVFSELEELTEFLKPIDIEGVCCSYGLDSVSLEKEMENSGCADYKKRINDAGFLEINQEEEHACQREDTKNTFSDIYVHEIPEKIVDHTHNEEEIYGRISKDIEFDGNERSQDAKDSENELEGTTHLTEANERGRRDDEEPVEEVIRMTHTDLYNEEIKAEEACRTTETSSNYELDETEHLIKSHVADTITDNDETPKVYSHYSQDNIMVASDASFQHQEKCEEPESVQDTNDFCEKHAVETPASVQGSLDLNETANQTQNTSETVTFDGTATNIGEAVIKLRQNQDQCSLGKSENDYNEAMLVEESTPESVEACEDVSKARDALDEEGDVIQSNSVNEENLSDNEHNKETYQIPSMSQWKSRPFKEEEIKTNGSNLKENHQASLMMEEKKANGHSRKVEMEKGHLKKIDEAKEREREREKEKLAVERVIREARERAFADARERAALERAAAEARKKNISDGRERLGKTTGQTNQTNEKTSTEKAAMEAKLRSQRAAVERATAEARARALERALSEKAASEARNKSDKSVADSGMKQQFHSKSFSYGEVRASVDVFDGANCDSAQRCKARSERHQRIGERVAKALAEKNMRDRLVQKEQEERNRIAEALDADVRRWSSGKTGNLRALLSTLQYILGPDSGWQPIPLTDIVTSTAVKKAYRKATLFVHPDKLQQRGASIQQKYICEKVFDLLKEAWNRFNMEER